MKLKNTMIRRKHAIFIPKENREGKLANFVFSESMLGEFL